MQQIHETHEVNEADSIKCSGMECMPACMHACMYLRAPKFNDILSQQPRPQAQEQTKQNEKLKHEQTKTLDKQNSFGSRLNHT